MIFNFGLEYIINTYVVVLMYKKMILVSSILFCDTMGTMNYKIYCVGANNILWNFISDSYQIDRCSFNRLSIQLIN